MSSYDPRRKANTGRARERQRARKQRREAMAILREDDTPSSKFRQKEDSRHVDAGEPLYQQIMDRVWLTMRDTFWYARHSRMLPFIAAGVGFVFFVVFVLIHVLGGRVFPNVWALGRDLGGLTRDEAEFALLEHWENGLSINVYADGEVVTEVKPAELGLTLDAEEMVSTAYGVGMSGVPFGYSLEPIVSSEYLMSEQFLLDIVEDVNKSPFDAGYEFSNGQVVGVPGKNGREVNISVSLDYIQNNAKTIIQSQRVDLITSAIPPDFLDPQPYIQQVRELTNQPFQLIGYDPFTDTYTTWETRPENVVKWLSAGASSLNIRKETFTEFVDALNETIKASGDEIRYIDYTDAIEQVEQSIAVGNTNAYLRMKNRPQIYEVQRGDSAFAIARKNGVPYYLLQEANSGRNMDALYPGDELNIPSKDLMLPIPPVPNKRIIVDLTHQQLFAFEDGEQVFAWRISSGRSSAPTSPGIFQILTQQDTAVGSGVSLCGSNGCGQWTMYWFMGIYEVSPGLINGFHGAVELPDGTYLNGGNVDYPSTFGCVMSLNEQAEQLYKWAELGTVVEIVSSEFLPRSELARRVYGESL